MKPLVLGAVFITALTSSAHAAVLLSLDSVTPDGSNFLYNYSGQLNPDQGISAGDQLVIVDFGGYVTGSVASSIPNVTASISDTLPGSLQLASGFSDNPAIPDLVFTYTGPDFHVTGGPFPPAVTFGGLSALSIFGDTTMGSYSAQAVSNVGANAGLAAFNSGRVRVPQVAAVPEPASWALMLTGFFGLGAMMRRRRRSELGWAAPIRA